MNRWIVRLGLAGLLVALAAYAWSRMNQDYDEDELEDEIPIEFDVPIERTPAAEAVAHATHDTGTGPGEDRQASPPAPANDGDDLTVIRGIGPVYQSKLHDLGIHTFGELVAADPARLEEAIQGVGVDVPDWIEQARALAGEQKA